MSSKFECPDPLARAPRVVRDGRAPDTRLYLAPPALQGAIAAILYRDTRDFELTDAQRGVYLAAMDRYAAGLPFDWAAMAQEEGFADQAHLSRTVKRITGFSPSEFAECFVEDEALWAYRLRV